jgi:osmotically-inducible protein OsmY
MTQSSALSGLTPRKHGEEKEDDLERTARLTTEILEDIRLAERIERALHATGYGVLRDIEVFVNARIVQLVGRVPSYYLKQIAQVTALATPGTHQLHNDLDVIPPNCHHQMMK